MPKKKEAVDAPNEAAAPERAEPAKSQKVPKLAKKNKSKLPRREKKALQKSSK